MLDFLELKMLRDIQETKGNIRVLGCDTYTIDFLLKNRFIIGSYNHFIVNSESMKMTTESYFSGMVTPKGLEFLDNSFIKKIFQFIRA